MGIAMFLKLTWYAVANVFKHSPDSDEPVAELREQ
jgi:hypothetical protein